MNIELQVKNLFKNAHLLEEDGFVADFYYIAKEYARQQLLQQTDVIGALPMVEIIGYLERLKHYLSSGSTYCFDNEHDLNDSEELEKFINSLRQ